MPNRKLTIYLFPEEFEALKKLAASERRTPAKQAAHMVAECLPGFNRLSLFETTTGNLSGYESRIYPLQVDYPLQPPIEGAGSNMPRDLGEE